MLKNYKIQEICTLEKGKQIDTTCLNDSNPYQYINGGINASGFYGKYNTDENTVIVSEGGASCGYVNYVTEKFWCGCHCYKLINPKVTPKYLYYALKGNQNSIMELRTGAAMPNIKKSSFNDMNIKLDDDKNVQATVISSLDKIQTLIDGKNTQLKSLDELVKSRFIEMFDTIDMSEERKDWVELEKISKIYSGTTPSTKDAENWNGDIHWITPAEMNKDTFYITDTVRKITEKGRKSKSLEMMPTNTVLLSTRAPIGKVGITGVPMTCNQGFKNFGCGDKLNPIYLYILLKENTEYLNSLGSGTTFLEVSKSKIAKTKIPVPPIELQNTFAEFVKQVDKSKFVVLLA